MMMNNNQRGPQFDQMWQRMRILDQKLRQVEMDASKSIKQGVFIPNQLNNNEMYKYFFI